MEAKPLSVRKYLLRKTAEKVVVHRSYKLKLYGNIAKTDTARYTQVRFNQYCNSFMGRVFFGQKRISTKGLGDLANKALYKSNGIVKSLRAASKATHNKMNVPIAKNVSCYASIEKSITPNFDYWIKVSSQFANKPIRLPAKSHKALNNALRNGWSLTSTCQFKIIDKEAYAIVFVERIVIQNKKFGRVIGVDVGYKYSIADSNGYLGRKLSGAIKRSKQIEAERRRQKHKISSKVKTHIKQILDIEAKRLIGRSDNMAFAVESPKRLANLSSGKLHGWARCYFANRLSVLSKENGIPIVEVNPYQTSMTCSKCKTIDKQSRNKQVFICTACGHTDHADINAAKNIALKGSIIIRSGKYFLSI